MSTWSADLAGVDALAQIEANALDMLQNRSGATETIGFQLTTSTRACLFGIGTEGMR